MDVHKAVVLLSGGADSSTLLYDVIFNQDIKEIYPIGFFYNQRHQKELIAAGTVLAKARKEAAKLDKVIHDYKVFRIPLDDIGGSPLSDPDLEVPKQEDNQQRSTVVPYRNMLMLTVAASYAETLGAFEIFLGACKEDFECYRDCRLAFFNSFNDTLLLGATQEQDDERTAPIVVTPFATRDKKEITLLGLKLNVPYDDTWTCYEGGEEPCHKCDACVERAAGFDAAYKELASDAQ